MTNDQDAVAIAKLRAWQGVKGRSVRWFEIYSPSERNERWLVEMKELHLPMSVPFQHIASQFGDTLPAAVDAALEAWEKMEGGAGMTEDISRCGFCGQLWDTHKRCDCGEIVCTEGDDKDVCIDGRWLCVTCAERLGLEPEQEET